VKHAVARWGLGKERLLEDNKDKDLTWNIFTGSFRVLTSCSL